MVSLYNIAVQTEKTVILGAGVTGLAAGIKTGYPIYEANSYSGGICYSYNKKGYRFDFGGGHWLFGKDKNTLRFIEEISPLKEHIRNSAVFFPDKKLYIPYPLQSHLAEVKEKLGCSPESKKSKLRNSKQLLFSDKLLDDFGPYLCNLFFFPFNDSYTAGLYKKIAAQDLYKNPVGKSKGYNSRFAYPKKGLGDLVQKMSDKCNIFYRKKAVKIDLKTKELYFQDKTSLKYQSLISTLPLNKVVSMANLFVDEPLPPYNSTLVINLGILKGRYFPPYQWVYIPKSQSGFHRIGFYSNVDSFFKKEGDRASLYIESSYPGNQKPSASEIKNKIKLVIEELKEWGFISKVEVIDTNWIETAYTWSWPGSMWREKALKALEEKEIRQIGRYGRWHFQGIVESIKEGLEINI